MEKGKILIRKMEAHMLCSGERKLGEGGRGEEGGGGGGAPL